MMQFIFEQIRAGGDRNFGYLVADQDGRQGVLVDPSYSPDVFVERAQAQGVRITHVINTHGHPDHVNGNARAVELTGAAVAAHGRAPVAPDVPLDDGQSLRIGGLELRVFYTPGHSADHLVIYEPSYKIFLTGDLLFVGKVGGTPTDDEARLEWRSLQRVLEEIPDEATVWPGHDYGTRPSSTIDIERKTNPFLLCADEAAFVQFKHDWPRVKKQHGLR